MADKDRKLSLIILALFFVMILPSTSVYVQGTKPPICQPACNCQEYVEVHVIPNVAEVDLNGQILSDGQTSNALACQSPYPVSSDVSAANGYMATTWTSSSFALSCYNECASTTITTSSGNGYTNQLTSWTGLFSSNSNTWISPYSLMNLNYGESWTNPWAVKSVTGSFALNPNATSPSQGWNLNVWTSSVSCSSSVCGYPEIIYGANMQGVIKGQQDQNAESAGLSFPVSFDSYVSLNNWIIQNYSLFTYSPKSSVNDISTDQWIVHGTSCCNSSDIELGIWFWPGFSAGCSSPVQIPVEYFNSGKGTLHNQNFCVSIKPSSGGSTWNEVGLQCDSCWNGNQKEYVGIDLSDAIQQAWDQVYLNYPQYLGNPSGYNVQGIETGLEVGTNQNMAIQYNIYTLGVGYGGTSGQLPQNSFTMLS